MLKDEFTPKWKFSRYLLNPTLIESHVSPQNISAFTEKTEADGNLFQNIKKKKKKTTWNPGLGYLS